jgi:mannitol-1-/sugar-/sorbitol-6-phosphatase
VADLEVTPARVSALLLDLDGTLVDSEPLHRAGFEAWFAARGWSYDDDVAGLFTGRRADDVFRTVDGPWRDGDPQVMLEEIVRLVPRDWLVEPLPGAAETIESARRAGIPLALVTSADTTWAAKALAPLGGLEVFDTSVTRDDVDIGKPDPACYALACERLGADAGAAVACEDAPNGVRAAVGAGVGTVLGVTTSFVAERLREAGATRTIPDLLTLPALLTG